MQRPRISATRRPTPRPPGTPRSFVCPACDFVLHDGVDYLHCPTCGLSVDWVDLREPLWCCAGCDAFVNAARDEWPRCVDCDRLMDRVHALEEPIVEATVAPSRLPDIVGGAIGTLYVICAVAQLIAMAFDPVGFAFVAPIVVLLLIAAGFVLVVFVLSLGELWALARDRATRVIHGLEHATIAVVREAGVRALGGRTAAGQFLIELRNDGRASLAAVRTAAEQAIRRVRAGEHQLAYSRDCGTSLLVGLLLVALVIVGGAAVGLANGAELRVVVALVTVAAAAAWLLAGPLGLLAQRLVTVSTRFADAQVERIELEISPDGHDVGFVVVVRVHDR